MKPLLYTKTLIALAVAIAATAELVSQAQEQPIPPPATASSLPPSIQPGTPVAEVVKLVQSGVDLGTIQSFIANTTAPFSLNTENILDLTDLGVPKEIINAMIEHDKALSVPTPVAAPATTVTTVTTTIAAPDTEISTTYFNDSLTPYGSWVEVEGYGRCWRPTVVIYDSSWQPYRERGHWVNSEYGWYWDSDYSWGVTFHYGRWFHHPRVGWCWWPDTVWAPSWVTWRSGDAYCGWAPLPPFAVYRPGGGFFYRGASVSVGFDFGLNAACFTFIPNERFGERHPRYYCVDARRNDEIFHHTTHLNNFSEHREGDHRGFVMNPGIPAERFNHDGHHPIQTIRVDQIPNAGRQGWRGNEGREGHDGHHPGEIHGEAGHNPVTIAPGHRNDDAINNRFNNHDNHNNNNPGHNPGANDNNDHRDNHSGQPHQGQPVIGSPAHDNGQNPGNHNQQDKHDNNKQDKDNHAFVPSHDPTIVTLPNHPLNPVNPHRNDNPSTAQTITPVNPSKTHFGDQTGPRGSTSTLPPRGNLDHPVAITPIRPAQNQPPFNAQAHGDMSVTPIRPNQSQPTFNAQAHGNMAITPHNNEAITPHNNMTVTPPQRPSQPEQRVIVPSTPHNEPVIQPGRQNPNPTPNPSNPNQDKDKEHQKH